MAHLYYKLFAGIYWNMLQGWCFGEEDLMKEAKVSVMCRFTSGEAYIRQCVESILDKSFKRVQVICVDDGSTDGTVQVLEEPCKKDDRLQILKQKNQYAGAARNFGMSVGRRGISDFPGCG